MAAAKKLSSSALLSGLKLLSAIIGIVIASVGSLSNPATLASAQALGLVSITVTNGLLTVSTLAGGSVTFSLAQTAAYSAAASGTADALFFHDGTNLLMIDTCTSQGVATNSPYYINAMTLNVSPPT